MSGNATLYAFVSNQTDMNTTVTTTLVPIKDELAKAAKSFASYPASITDTRTKVKAMREKATDPQKKVAYDENSNLFVRLYRWFAGTPWENFEKKLEKYDLTLEDVIAHLELNKADFINNKGAIDSMGKIIEQMKTSVDSNITKAGDLTETSTRAKEAIEEVLEKHLEAVQKAKEDYKPAHKKEVELIDAKAEKKRREAIEKRKTRANDAIIKLGKSSGDSSNKTAEMKTIGENKLTKETRVLF